MKDIQEASQAHQITEFQYQIIGIPCQPEELEAALWSMGKVMSREIMNKWIELNTEYLEEKGKLMANEFLYLVANSHDRQEMLSKIPKINRNPRMDKKTGLFKVDDEFHKTYVTPDYKLQTIFHSTYSMDKAIYSGLMANKAKHHKEGRKTKKVLKEDHQIDDKEDLKKKLQNEELMIEIKAKLKETYNLLKKSKLNGKFVYDELKEAGAENLPMPLQGKIRPKTAINSPNARNKSMLEKSINPQAFITQAKSAQQSMTNFRSANSTATGFGFPKLDMSSSMSKGRIKQVLSPKDKDFDAISLIETPHMTHEYVTMQNKKNVETMMTLEQLIDTEFDVFERKCQANEDSLNRSKTTFYTGGVASRPATRIHSSYSNSNTRLMSAVSAGRLNTRNSNL